MKKTAHVKKEIRVVELFAGVGGFRAGLEKASKNFKTIWANQWEPSTKVQHAFEIYNKHFKETGSKNVNEDITKVWKDIPEHDLLVGGFPCQDYSVAQGNRAKGIEGKKGVLWWEIYKIVEFRKPKMILLENVDRLLNSPTSRRGRDFAIMLRSLNDLGYVVEWKAITASEYGMAQKRRRVFIYAVRRNVLEISSKKLAKELEKTLLNKIFKNQEMTEYHEVNISNDNFNDLVEITNEYNYGKFLSTGISINGHVLSAKYKAVENDSITTLGDILDLNRQNYIYLNEQQIEKASWTKASKKIERIAKTGFTYNYTEGKMSFPEDLNKPGRTMLTSEGTINRSSHFIADGKKVRFLTPIEAERLNGFPDNWTYGAPEKKRFFFMGNALVTGIVEKIGREIAKDE